MLENVGKQSAATVWGRAGKAAGGTDIHMNTGLHPHVHTHACTCHNNTHKTTHRYTLTVSALSYTYRQNTLIQHTHMTTLTAHTSHR